VSKLLIHYQQGDGWPVCGERPMSYDSTEALALVECQKCLDVITPTFTRAGGTAVCERCEKPLCKHPHMKFGALELFKMCDGSWVKL
jgi:hypothetical protein